MTFRHEISKIKKEIKKKETFAGVNAYYKGKWLMALYSP